MNQQMIDAGLSGLQIQVSYEDQKKILRKANGLEDAGDMLLQLSADLQIIRLDHE